MNEDCNRYTYTASGVRVRRHCSGGSGGGADTGAAPDSSATLPRARATMCSRATVMFIAYLGGLWVKMVSFGSKYT
jgi:hypothetical protein